jgi:hypothetical protein
VAGTLVVPQATDHECALEERVRTDNMGPKTRSC